MPALNNHSHFADEETEAQKGWVTSPGPQSMKAAEQGFVPVSGTPSDILRDMSWGDRALLLASGWGERWWKG